jgi:hypothetical protein
LYIGFNEIDAVRNLKSPRVERCLREVPVAKKMLSKRWATTVSVGDGAEGQNRTGYAGLFRAALYQ